MTRKQAQLSGRKRRPGPVYDEAMKGLIEGDPVAVCRLLGIPISTKRAVPQLLSSSFGYPMGALYADAVIRVGVHRIVHLECERQLRAHEMVARMVGYRGVIQRRHRKEVLSQYLIVLGGGRVVEFIDPVLSWFWGCLGVVFMRDLDPEVFLNSPSLAPLAALGHGTSRVRREAFARALALIRDEGGERADELKTFAITLAAITLDRSIINRTVEEEEMTPEEFVNNLLWNGSYGESVRERLKEQSLAEGLAQGLEQGLEKGLEQGLVKGLAEGKVEGRAEERELVLSVLLKDRFGAQPEVPAVAHRLAGALDAVAAVHAVTSAAALADLVDGP
jgi:hypothetical protein